MVLVLTLTYCVFVWQLQWQYGHGSPGHDLYKLLLEMPNSPGKVRVRAQYVSSLPTVVPAVPAVRAQYIILRLCIFSKYVHVAVLIGRQPWRDVYPSRRTDELDTGEHPHTSCMVTEYAGLAYVWYAYSLNT